MATVIRTWRIEGEHLSEIAELASDPSQPLESRIENLLETQADAIRDDLLIIGKQVSTASGPLDLLGITSDGTLVVIELKRGRAPRETVAQAIDYASWLAEQDSADIRTIAEKYLQRSLEEAFQATFDQPLPELELENVAILVVASRLDGSTERMIQFLSRLYGMDIDGVIFRYLKLPKGDEILIKTSVVSDEQRAIRSERGRPTPEALIQIAAARGAQPVIEVLRGLNQFLTEGPEKTYGGSFRYFGSGRMMCGLNAASNWGAPPGSVDVWVSYGCWAQLYGLDKEQVIASLNAFGEQKRYAKDEQIVVRIGSVSDARQFVELLRGWALGAENRNGVIAAPASAVSPD